MRTTLGQGSWACALPAVPALLHAGHGQGEWTGTLLHYLLEPEHLPAALLLAAGLLLAWRWRPGRRAQRPRETL